MRSYLIAATVASALATTTRLAAQANDTQTAPLEEKRGWQFLVANGTVAPTGSLRQTIKRGKLTAAQLSYTVRPSLALTTTLGWARSRDIATAGDPKVNVFTYDVGAEVRAPRLTAGTSISFSSFAGVGAGGRSYDYRGLDKDATHNVAAYGSIGGELGVRRVRLRLEARDYVSGFKPLNAEGSARTGNDVVVMAGLRIVRR